MAFQVPPLKINQGQAFAEDLRLVDDDGDPVNTAEYTFTSQIRSEGGGVLYETFTVTPSPSEDGVIELSLTQEQVAALTFTTAYYDLRAVEIDSDRVVVSEKQWIRLALPVTEEVE